MIFRSSLLRTCKDYIINFRYNTVAVKTFGEILNAGKAYYIYIPHSQVCTGVLNMDPSTLHIVHGTGKRV